MPDAPFPITATRLSCQSYVSSLFWQCQYPFSDVRQGVKHVPAGSVNNFSLETRQSLNIRPFPVTKSFTSASCPRGSSKQRTHSLREPCRIDEDFGLVFLDNTILLNLQLPLPRPFLPDGLQDPSIQLDVIIETPLAHRAMNILTDLSARGIKV